MKVEGKVEWSDTNYMKHKVDYPAVACYLALAVARESTAITTYTHLSEKHVQPCFEVLDNIQYPWVIQTPPSMLLAHW